MIDAHVHLWDPARRAYPWMRGAAREPLRRRFTAQDLRPAAGAAGVGAAVLVQTVADPVETQEFLATAQGSGGLLAAVVGWVDLTADVAAQVEELRGGPGGALLAGVRHQVEDEPGTGWLLREDVRRGTRTAAGLGLVHDLLVRADQLGDVPAVLDENPQGRFVLDHAAKPPLGDDAALGEWSRLVARAARRENLVCKVSGLFTLLPPGRGPEALRPVVEHLLEVFGPRRLLAGSDWPVSTLAGGYERVQGWTRELLAGLSDAERERVLGGTAREVYGLPRRSAGGVRARAAAVRP